MYTQKLFIKDMFIYVDLTMNFESKRKSDQFVFNLKSETLMYSLTFKII